VSIQAQVLNPFMHPPALHPTYLFISHDLGVVEHISDRLIMYPVASSNRDPPRNSAAPNHPYTQALLAEVGKVEPKSAASSRSRGRFRRRSLRLRAATSTRAVRTRWRSA
jgi:ABC-type oligopeptide transport system ATPase subunit